MVGHRTLARLAGPLLGLGLAAGLVAGGPAFASPNLLTNGSFESGLAGWTVGGAIGSYPISVIVTDGVTGSAFGEAVPADNAASNSPDAAGTHGTYFVDDVAHQILTQSVFLAPGTYEIGFDGYAPQNGFNNFFDATFSGTIAMVLLANYSVHTQNQPRTWINYSGIANVLSAGLYQVSFDFQPGGVPASDVVIDRVYVVSSTATTGVDIPSGIAEPASLAALGVGLLGLGVLRRRTI